MQRGKAALERAVDRGHHRVVDYLVNQMDITQFNMVCIIATVCVCVYTVGRAVMTMLYMLRL